MAHSVLYPTAGGESEESDTGSARRLRSSGRGGESTDIKPLQGIERCIELRMRLVEGASPRAVSVEPEREQMEVDLARLSRDTLLELLKACPSTD